MAEKPDEGVTRQHIPEAQMIIEGEDQLSRDVARLQLAERAEILSASPIRLPSLVANGDECRVRKDEKRSFEEVIRVWPLHVPSGLEGS